MKKVYFAAIAVISLIPFVSKAQWSTTSPDTHFTYTGNVGIGTASPPRKLTISNNGAEGLEIGPGNLVGDAANAVTSVYYNRNTSSYIDNVQFAGTYWFTIGGRSTPSILINSAGNVGIGTATPVTLLHTVVPSTKTAATGNVVSFLSTNEATAPFGLRTMIYGAAALSDRYITLQTTDYASVDGGNIILQPATGNVGIGTTGPLAKLSVVGGALTTSGAGLSISSALTTGRLTTGQVNSIHNWLDNESLELSSGSSEKTGIAIEGQTSALGSTVRMFTGGNENLRMLANGKVGIGTTTPDELLSVNGTIHSKEVKVNLTGLPDYVFKPEYHLPTLAEVKSYIDKNSHLPEIPSAQEVEKNGLNLGEMNKLLLKKVEELTLYLVEKDKEVKGQQGEIKQQKAVTQNQQSQIDELRKQVETLLKKKP
ncbi:autotransporter outer membrane beta-barrel domain-containing protein [Mucilaginibacter boryungensis]|uniref:Peptidase S74 domain-containing protein n=1 Tax=Mucilaginibacter boryungensis TaxID=768480 RepID=A0ABR9XLZ0_9SPHI|nr:hypothetical protein [Mucilaginibacter boryungensis]MBE9668255.1 hypothetical protein [Mucilaginibacter boryungensis]